MIGRLKASEPAHNLAQMGGSIGKFRPSRSRCYRGLKASRLASILIACGVFIAVLVPAGQTQASSLSYVPLDHWSYQVFYRLSSLGLVSLHALTMRPITRLEAQRLVREAFLNLSQVDPVIVRLAQEDLQRLATEFSTDPSVVVDIGIMATNRTPAQFSPSHSLGASSVATQYSPSPNLLFYGRVAGGGEAGEPSRGELYAAFRLGSVLGVVGRTSVSWGPSLRSNLLLSDNAGTLPLVSFTAEVPPLRLTKVVALLERRGGNPPGDVVLFATRLDWLVAPEFRIGLSEGVVTAWGGPLTLYHVLQPLPAALSGIVGGYELHDARGQARNTKAEVDFDWLVRPGVRLYGSFFVNDAPELISERLARVGVLGGLFLIDPFGTGRTNLRIEYSAITNGTYNYPSFPGLEHAYLGRSLGHWLGPDGDDLYLELTHQLDYITSLQVSYALTRHGQGRIGQPSPPPEGWFLSGVVEQRHTLGFNLFRIYSPSLEVNYRVEIASITNQGNVAGANSWEGVLGVGLTYRWPSPMSADEPSLEPGLAAEGGGAAPLGSGSPASIFPGQVGLRSWAPTMTSIGSLSGPSSTATVRGVAYRTVLGTTPLAVSYDSGDGQVFWSADLHYPLAQFRDGAITIFAGWGGVTFSGELGGATRNLGVSQPRVGAAFSYYLTFNDDRTPLYLTGEIAGPPLRAFWGSAASDRLSYAWTYFLGVGVRSGSGLAFEAGYRGVAAAWQEATPNQTYIRWDGVYISLLFN